MSRINRWMVPAGVAVAVLGVAAVTTALRASADPQLPDRSAAQLLVDVQTARLEGLSGTVVLRSDLGLPSLPIPAGAGGTELTAFINGSHTLRIWYSGPDKTRIAILSTLGESDIIRNGRDVWTWSSAEKTAQHRLLPENATGLGVNGAIIDPGLLPAAPQQIADQVLSVLEPTTVVSTAGTSKVAGRSAYELVLSPRDEASLVNQVRIAVDGEQHLPLRLQIFAKGYGTPAFEIGFTQVSFQRPGDEHFKFNPPAGTQVIEEGGAPEGVERKPLIDPQVRPDLKPQPPAGKPVEPGGAPAAEPETNRTAGESWTTVVVEKVSDGANSDNPLGPLVATLPAVNGDWGSGRLLRTRLFSVLLTEDGWLLFGAVKPERLYEVARTNT